MIDFYCKSAAAKVFDDPDRCPAPDCFIRNRKNFPGACTQVDNYFPCFIHAAGNIHVNRTGFSDNIPTWLKPYLAAAQRAGLMENWPEGDIFRAEEAITGQQAAVLLQNALALPLSSMSTEDEDLAWSVVAITTLAENGILLQEGMMTRGQVAMALYQASCVAPTAPGTAVFYQM